MSLGRMRTLYLVLVALVCAGACTGGDLRRTDQEQVGTVVQAVVQTMRMSLSIPAAVDVRSVAVAGSSKVQLGNYSQLLGGSTGYADSSNGGGEALYDTDVHVGSITVAGSVELRDRASVSGSITANGKIYFGMKPNEDKRNSSVTVSGPVTPNAPVVMRSGGWDVPFDVGTYSPPTIESDTTLDPGSFGTLTIQKGTVTLNPGIYYIDTLTLQPDAKIRVSSNGGLAYAYIYVRTTFDAHGTVTANHPENVLLGYFGTKQLTVEKTFEGTIVAPNALVDMGVGATPHIGAVFAKEVRLEPYVKLSLKPFSNWKGLVPDLVPGSDGGTDGGRGGADGGATGPGGGAGTGGAGPSAGGTGSDGGPAAGGSGGLGGTPGAGGADGGGGPARTPCNSDGDCASGEVCGENNGACYGLPRAKRVCWKAECSTSVEAGGCGTPDSPCGTKCDCWNSCDENRPCPGDEGCKRGICFPPQCPSDDPLLCGSPSSLCGPTCVSKPNCAAATCGNSDDGIGGQCPGVCGPEQGPCKDDVNCVSGYSCIHGACLPGGCAFQALAPPLCGSSDSLCGKKCPEACKPRCDGRSCGPDPNCGTSCGTCSGGAYCSDGQCIAPKSELPAQSSTSTVGAVNGAFGVAENGIAQYSIPIEVPPGRAGIEPALTLRYSGTRDNGDVGVGWHLDGLSQITRCPRSQVLDGASRPVKNDNGDRFCLDGKRLEVVKGIDSGTIGTYGDNGTEYRTLIDSFARIVSYQDATAPGPQLDSVAWIKAVLRPFQGPDSFRVWTKDGRILTYGGTREAIMMARTGVRYGWLVSRVEDRFGNTMTFSYTNLTTDVPDILAEGFVNVVRPRAIFYTGHADSAGSREVRFAYEDRGDPQIRIRQGGMPFVANRLLTHITTLVNGKEVKDYRLHYTGQSTSLIDSVSECTGTGSTDGTGTDNPAFCKDPTRFWYRSPEKTPMYKDRAELLNVNAMQAAELDANGDGVPDFLVTDVKVNAVSANPELAAAKVISDVAVGVGSSFLGVGGIAVNAVWSLVSGPFFGLFESQPTIDVYHRMYLGTSDRSAPTPVPNVQGIPCNGGQAPYFILDYDRDGKDDIAVDCALFMEFARSDGKGNFEPLPTATVPLTRGLLELANWTSLLFDIDGDSLQDLVWCENTEKLNLRRRLSPSLGFADAVSVADTSHFCDKRSPTYRTFDIDGDGTPDLLVGGPTGWKVLRYSPSKDPQLWFEPVKFTDAGLSQYGGDERKPMLLGDFNGDGLVDIENDTDDEQSVIWLNAGAGRFWSRSIYRPKPDLKPGAKYSFRRTAIIDFDGDGRDDLLETRETEPSAPCTEKYCWPVIAMHAMSPNSLVTALSNTNLSWRSEDDDHAASFRIASDLDGDGIRDLFGLGGVFYGQNANNLLLETVIDGIGNITRIKYDEPNTYGTDERCSGSVWPEKCLPRMTGLVSSYREGFIPKGGTEQFERTYSYRYLNGRVNVTGLGWLGFDQRVASRTAAGSPATHTETIGYTPVARYDLSGKATQSTDPPYLYPLAGLPQTITVYETEPATASHPLQAEAQDRATQIHNSWEVKLSADGRPFPWLHYKATRTFDVPSTDEGNPGGGGGVLIGGQFETFEVDGYGNETGRVSYTGCSDDGSSPSDGHETISRIILPDRAHWLISQPDTLDITTTTGELPEPFGPERPAAQHAKFTYVNGKPETVTRSSGTSPSAADQQHKTTYHRDEFGNVLEVIEEVQTGEPSRTTSITYDGDNIFPNTITDPANHLSHMEFDSRWGTPTKIIDPNGITEGRQYDGFGRLTETSNPEGTTIAAYSAFSHLDGTTLSVNPRVTVLAERHGTKNADGGYANSVYDGYGRLVRTRTAGFRGTEVVVEQTYDALGRILQRTLPHTAATTSAPSDHYTYDHLNRITSVDHPDGSSKQVQYASARTLDSAYSQWLQPTYFGVQRWESFAEATRTIDEEGHQNVAVTSCRGHVVRSIDGDNVVNTVYTSDYYYGAIGQLEQAKDNLGNITRFVYDDFGRKTRSVDPDTGGTFYAYNGYDELKTSRDPGLITRVYEHDPLGRLTKITDPSGVTEWIYDQGENGIGRLSETISPATAENPQGQHVSYHYEPKSNTSNRGLLSWIDYQLDGKDHSTSFEYDDLGRTKFIHYPRYGTGDPIVAQYQYDDTSGALSSIQEVGSGATKPIWQIDEAYDAHLIQKETFGNGAAAQYGYNQTRHWIESIQTTLAAASIQSIATPRYKDGRVFHRTTPDLDREYQYDALARLHATVDKKGAGGADGGTPGGATATSYGYDPIGNILFRGAVEISYYPAYPHHVETAGMSEYAYDPNGRVRYRSGPDIPGGSQTFTYTPFDLPSSITTGQTETLFEYTADEERVVRRDPDKTRYSVGGLYERVIDTASGDILEQRFRIYAGSRQIAEIVKGNSGNKTLYMHADALGTIDTVSDDQQHSYHQSFDPFGSPLDNPPSAITRAGFTGHQHDTDLGLVDMKGRMYDPLAGRFMSPDPIMQAPLMSQGLNRYSYVFNDPVNNVDPSGFVLEGLGYAGFSGMQSGAAAGGGLGAVGGLAGAGFNVVVSLVGGLPGQGSPGGQYNALPSAAPASTAVTREGLNAVGQAYGNVGPNVPQGGGGGAGGGDAYSSAMKQTGQLSNKAAASRPRASLRSREAGGAIFGHLYLEYEDAAGKRVIFEGLPRVTPKGTRIPEQLWGPPPKDWGEPDFRGTVFEAEDDPSVPLTGVGPTTFDCLETMRIELNHDMIRYDAQNRTGHGHNSNWWAGMMSYMCGLKYDELPGLRILPGAWDPGTGPH